MLRLKRVTINRPMYEFRVFKNAFDADQTSKIYDLMALLYQSYVEEEHWNPDSSTPPGFEVLPHPNDPSRKIFSDKHPIRCHWFGIYEKNANKLVACARAVLPMENGHLELHEYPAAQNIIETHLIHRKNLMELNRCAVIKELQGAGIAMFLLHQVLEHYKNEAHTFITTTCDEGLIRAYRKLKFLAPEDAQFNYEPTDPKLAQLFIISPEIQNQATTELAKYLGLYKSMNITGNTLKQAQISARLFQLPQNPQDESAQSVAAEEREIAETFKFW